jgi:hypothetical protein
MLSVILEISFFKLAHNDPRASEGRGIAFLTIDSAQSTKGIKKFEIT